MSTFILSGFAVVSFRREIENADDLDVEELRASVDMQECQIDDHHLRDIDHISDITMEVRP